MNIVIDILLLSLIGISAYNIGALRAYDKGYKRGIDDMMLFRRYVHDDSDTHKSKNKTGK